MTMSHSRAARWDEALAARLPRAFCTRMSLQVIRRVALHSAGLGAQIHPVLQRAYAARGVRSATDLDISLARLLPVGTLAACRRR